MVYRVNASNMTHIIKISKNTDVEKLYRVRISGFDGRNGVYALYDVYAFGPEKAFAYANEGWYLKRKDVNIDYMEALVLPDDAKPVYSVDNDVTYDEHMMFGFEV